MSLFQFQKMIRQKEPRFLSITQLCHLMDELDCLACHIIVRMFIKLWCVLHLNFVTYELFMFGSTPGGGGEQQALLGGLHCTWLLD
jgi:hypothetical protein